MVLNHIMDLWFPTYIIIYPFNKFVLIISGPSPVAKNIFEIIYIYKKKSRICLIDYDSTQVLGIKKKKYICIWVIAAITTSDYDLCKTLLAETNKVGSMFLITMWSYYHWQFITLNHAGMAHSTCLFWEFLLYQCHLVTLNRWFMSISV